jgi:peptide/nickel transport system permease protein
MGLKEYIARRAIYSLILIYFVATFNFLIFVMMPGDPLSQYVLSIRRTHPQRFRSLIEIYGLDKSLTERYFIYIINMLTWNWGKTQVTGSPVAKEMMYRLTNTLMLMGLAAVLSILIGTLLGIIAAYKRGELLDTSLVTTSLVTYSLPIFWLGWMIIYIFAFQLKWFPSGGITPEGWAWGVPTDPIEFISGRLYHLVLPTLTLVLFSFGGWLLLARAAVLETITEDYVVTARAKGLKERTILLKHVLKNASLPIVTNVALTFGFLITGAIITETLFNYEGMGRWIWQAVFPGEGYPDLPVLQAIFFVVALCVIIANFIADLLYGVLDPRIKYG